MTKPMQLFVREVAAPILRSAGYKGSGGTYRYLAPGGHLAVFQLRAWRLMQRELEFHVDEGLVVQATREFISETMDLRGAPSHQPGPLAKSDSASGALRGRLTHSAGLHGDYWQFDRDDQAMVDLFSSRLAADAAWLRSLTDPLILEDLLRSGDASASSWWVYPPAVVLSTVLVDQGRSDDLPAVLEDTEGTFQHDDLVTWVDRRRARM